MSPSTKRGLFLEFGIGLPLNAALAALLYAKLLPEYSQVATAVDRVVFALACSGLPAVMMLLGMLAVATGRGLSTAIDPLLGLESRTLQVHIRYFTNTVEQLVLFVVSSAALSPFLDETTIRIVPAFAVLFVVNRGLFWAGYLKDPSLRGLGLSGTLYPIAAMTIAAAYFSARLILLGS